jgi:thiol-disulfide isomerase/thioredoxin
MKKIWVVIAIIAVLVGAAIVYVASRDGDMPYSQNQQSSTKQGDDRDGKSNSEQPTEGSKQTHGQYIDYSEELLASTEGRKWIFFHAPWCPQCRALEADIVEKGVPQGLTIFKIDYDTSTAERQKYGVTLQTTVVEVDDNSNETAKFVAYDDPSLAAVLSALGE